MILDRDGTIVVERHYLSDPEQLELLPGAAEGLRQLRTMGFGLVVITNQSAIGRGLYDVSRLEQIHDRLQRLLEMEGVRLDGIYVCPHTPEDRCRCRKPETELLQRAVKELGVSLQTSFVVGDKGCDVELGRRVGARTFLVRTGYGAAVAAAGEVKADYLVDDLREMASVVRGLMATRKPVPLGR